jgi:hypothetical protein
MHISAHTRYMTVLLCCVVGQTFAAEIVACMWRVFTDRDYERRAMMQGLRGLKVADLSEDTARARKEYLHVQANGLV